MGNLCTSKNVPLQVDNLRVRDERLNKNLNKNLNKGSKWRKQNNKKEKITIEAFCNNVEEFYQNFCNMYILKVKMLSEDYPQELFCK